MAADPASNAAGFLVDPALGLASDRAAGRAIAVEMAAAAALWKLAFGGAWLERFSYATLHGLTSIAAAAGAGLLLGPIAARARAPGSAAMRAIGLGVAGGLAITMITAPLAHAGVIWAEGVSRLHIIVDDAFTGAVLGFFAGLAAAPLAARHVRIRRAPSLDGAPRLYLAASVALLVLTAALLVVGVVIPGVLLLATAAGLGLLAVRAGRRRLAWLTRVRDGGEPGFRIDAIDEEAEPAALPAFLGTSADARGVLLRAAEAPARTPYRAGGPWIRVARVPLDPRAASREASRALWLAARGGALDGLFLVGLLALPVLLAVLAIGP